VETVGSVGRRLSPQKKLLSLVLGVALGSRFRRLQRGFAEARRRALRRRHVVSAFLEVDDPYSYLLGHYLPVLREHYDIDLGIHLAASMGEAYKPMPGMLSEYATLDCGRLARELGVPFLDRGDTPPVELRRALLDDLATTAERDELLTALTEYWRGDAEAVRRRVAGATAGTAGPLLAQNRRLLERLGHYNSATLHYGGEWYWGIDRLHYLTQRLDALGANRNSKANPQLAAIRQVMDVSLPLRPPAAARALPPLEYFHSFRSPYSYLGLRRIFAVADAFGLQLRVRPVLPMVMRGMQMPRRKLMYIVRDANREAERLGVPFGRIADPVAAVVERCFAVFAYAQAEKRGRDFLLQAGEGVWARAIDLATDAGMRDVTHRCGLFWPDVLAAMKDESWRVTAAQNRESLTDAGAWGVPTMRLGDFVVWGQDRIWLLVRHIEELCESGDGILK